ncbi:MAG: DUF3105 domain-containing protein [Myxococcales bacterium]|nr:DUF3105 domain-containing protein [Myxococcales bacterium]
MRSLIGLPLALGVACRATVPAPVTTQSSPCDSCGGECVEETQDVASANNHVSGDVVYEDPPPTSGDHNACWAQWGLHDIDPGDEHWVHNLEHGGVVFLYSPDDCAGSEPDAAGDSGDSGVESAATADCVAQAAALEAVLGSASDRRWIITPSNDLPDGWAAVSWGHRMRMGCFDIGALQAYFEAHVGRAPEDTNGDPPTSCP